ncbi:hypothetical protein GALMADRAFT_216368 [Galerina marginata CBS 339.88]|uniref:Uncharacterized protein n=1 Tax=Galerina marginata (strain CBS 339.88) TaxID=685588 RepID=A0A067SL80_GALM3|nr:hypothetical protein GALMADRAFT_216368 [Galerina marginata CBS 339.88]
MSPNNTKKTPGFKTCGHDCHKDEINDSQTRKDPMLRGVHIFNTSGSGQRPHFRKHQCSPTSPCTLPKGDCWPTTDQEYIKFAHRLMHGKKGSSVLKIVNRFSAAWRNLYPDQEVRMTNGIPDDLSLDPNYPCPTIPWLDAFVTSANRSGNSQPSMSVVQTPTTTGGPSNLPVVVSKEPQNVTEASSSRASSPPGRRQPDSNVARLEKGKQRARYSDNTSAPPSEPHASTSGQPGHLAPFPSSHRDQKSGITSSFSPQLVDLPASCNQTPDTDSPSLDKKISTPITPNPIVDYIQKHDFEVDLRGYFPHLKDVFPGFNDYRTSIPTRQRVFFVLCPEYRLQDDVARNPYLSENIISLANYEDVNKVAENYVCLLENGKDQKEGYVHCYYNGWLNLAFEMKKQEAWWDVTYVSWPAFKEAILQTAGPLWTDLRQGDLVLGSIDFSCDFL